MTTTSALAWRRDSQVSVSPSTGSSARSASDPNWKAFVHVTSGLNKLQKRLERAAAATSSGHDDASAKSSDSSSLHMPRGPAAASATAALHNASAMVNVAEVVAAMLQDEAAVVTVAAGAALALYLVTTSLRSTNGHHLSKRVDGKVPIRTFASLPQPASTLPILGNTLDAVRNQDRLYDWFVEQQEALKQPWRISIIGYPPTMVVSTPALFEDVLKTHYASFPKGDDLTYIFRDVFGRGILAVNGDAWHAKRKAASSMFSFQMLKDTMHPVVTRRVQTLCDTLKQYEARGAPISLKRVMVQFTMDVFTRVGFGVDLHCLESGLDGREETEFAYASRVASTGMQQRFLDPMWLWRLKRFLNVGLERDLRESVQFVDALVYGIINASIEQKRATKRAAAQALETDALSSSLPAPDASVSTSATATPTADAQPKDLISIFLENGVDGTEHDTREIRDSVVNFIFAGSDTSAQSMSFLIVMLNRHPRVLDKIREELRAKLPDLSTDGEEHLPSKDALSELVYLEAAIRESLRLNPPAAITTRAACEDVVMSDGTFVPKGTRVFLAFYVAMRSKDVWGEDALEFKPERWIDPVTNELIAVSPFKFPAFLAGPRACIGMKLAMMEMKTNMAALLSRFDLSTVEDPWDLTYEVAVASGVKGSLMVHVSSIRGRV